MIYRLLVRKTQKFKRQNGGKFFGQYFIDSNKPDRYVFAMLTLFVPSPLPCPFFGHFLETLFAVMEAKAEEGEAQPQSCVTLNNGQKMPLVGLG